MICVSAKNQVESGGGTCSSMPFSMAENAAWRLHCRVSEASKAMMYLEFRREITQGLVRSSWRCHLERPTAPVPSCKC